MRRRRSDPAIEAIVDASVSSSGHWRRWARAEPAAEARWGGRPALGAWAEPGARSPGTARFRRRWQREPITVREIMEATAAFASPSSTLCEVCRIMRDEECAVVPVVGEGRTVVGIVIDRDVVLRCLGEASPSLLAADVMAHDFDCVVPDERIEDVAILMGERSILRLPVVDRTDRFLGMVSMARIARHADDDEDLQDTLGRIASARSFWHRGWR
ncbi:MAG: CBS domain-containing protein [Deltaproteobacteria bacterium]|nr:CBS domain-containing protein [Deltaproteobacteria bacterium]